MDEWSRRPKRAVLDPRRGCGRPKPRLGCRQPAAPDKLCGSMFSSMRSYAPGTVSLACAAASILQFPRSRRNPALRAPGYRPTRPVSGKDA